VTAEMAETATAWTPYAALSRLVPLPHGRHVQLFEQGSGAPLVYLHGAGLQFGWNETLELLSQQRRVIAPLFAGFGESTGVEEIGDSLDAIVYLNEVFDALGLDRVDLVGFDLGGMFAAEVAAVTPARVRRLVLAAPFGLWLADHETMDFFTQPAAALTELMFARPSGPVAQAYNTVPDDPAQALEYTIQRTRALATSTRFLWPIPDRGLSRRLHRIKAPTLLVWGRDDRIVPPLYAEAFRQQIPNGEVTLLDGGHMLPLEEGAALAAAVLAFLA